MNSVALNALLQMNGGKGSGNFGHAGRPGQIGGSGNGKGSSSKGSGSKGTSKGGSSKSGKSSGSESKSQITKDLDDAYKVLCPGGAGSHPDNLLDGTGVKEDFDTIKRAEGNIADAEDLVKRAKRGDIDAIKELRSTEYYQEIYTTHEEELKELRKTYQETRKEATGYYGGNEDKEVAKAFRDIDIALEDLIDRAEDAQTAARRIAKGHSDRLKDY